MVIELQPELMPPYLDDLKVRRVASLAETIRDALECGHDATALLEEFNAVAPNPCQPDAFFAIYAAIDSDEFAREALAPIPYVPDITREELVELVRRARNILEYTEFETTFWRRVLERNVMNPHIGDLMRKRLDAEEVIEQALAYQSLITPPPSDDATS